MPFNSAIIPKLVKAEAVTLTAISERVPYPKKQHILIKGHAADSYIPEIKFSHLLSLRNTKIRQLTRPQKAAYSVTMS